MPRANALRARRSEFVGVNRQLPHHVECRMWSGVSRDERVGSPSLKIESVDWRHRSIRTGITEASQPRDVEPTPTRCGAAQDTGPSNGRRGI